MTAMRLKSVGASGQISIGKKYAGRFFELNVQGDGAIVLRPMREVPEAEARLHHEPMKGEAQEGRGVAIGNARSPDPHEEAPRAKEAPSSGLWRRSGSD